MTTSDRTAQLDADLRSIAASSRPHGRDAGLTALGVLLMISGIVVAIIGYAISATTSDPLRQSDARALGPIAITLAIAGLALFLRYSTAQFMRFWLARLIHERQRTNDSEPVT